MTLPRFLNVDLDLYADSELGLLVRALQPEMHVMHERAEFASLELSSGSTPPIDGVLNGIADIVEAISLPAQRVWSSCKRRVMNVGFEAGTGHASKGIVIPASTLRRLVSSVDV